MILFEFTCSCILFRDMVVVSDFTYWELIEMQLILQILWVD